MFFTWHALQLIFSISPKFKINYCLGTSYYRVVQEGLEILHNTFFFSAQLVPVQILSALFPLRTFFPVANLTFKCVAWHVCLEFLFDENRFLDKQRLWSSMNFLFFSNLSRKYFYDANIIPTKCVHLEIFHFDQ